MAHAPTTITITGAGGQIGYALLFRIAAGDMLGPDRPLRLRLLEIPQGVRSAEGAALELQDCAFPLLRSVDVTDDAGRGFDGCELALLVGARPRTAGMERGDLLAANAGIFGPQGAAIAAHAASDVHVVTVGNPANTNALIAQTSADGVPPERFSALTRLDHNRAVGQLAALLDAMPDGIRDVAIWGNHSATQFPDLAHATVAGAPALTRVPQAWYREEFIPTVQQRGAAIIKARGASSAASAASAAIDHVRDWALGTNGDDWVSMAVASDGSYGIPEGVVYSYPVRCARGEYRIVQGLSIDDFARGKLAATDKELREERAGVADLI